MKVGLCQAERGTVQKPNEHTVGMFESFVKIFIDDIYTDIDT